MSSNGSSSEQGCTSPKKSSPFVEQGAEIVSNVGTLTLRVLSYYHERGGIKATLRLEGENVTRQDVVFLDSEKHREKFVDRSPADEKVLLRDRLVQLYDHLRAKPIKATTQGRAIEFESVEAWADPVEGNTLLNDLVVLFKRFVVMPLAGYYTIALFVLHTYVFNSGDCSPYIGLTSPLKRCGKTRVEEILSELVRRPLLTSNISAAALFRAIEKFTPTLIIDEADTFMAMSEELRGILNSGHTKKTAFTTRTVGDDHEVRNFSTWAPKVYAMIGKPPDTVRDRTIEIPMRRRKPDEFVERYQGNKMQVGFLSIRQMAVRWGNDNADKLVAADPKVPDSLNDRAQDLWRPLVAIADLVGGPWPEQAREAANELSGENELPDDSIGTLLLTDLKNFFEPAPTDEEPDSKIKAASFTEDIISHLETLPERSWKEFNRGKPISDRQLANRLRPFGISSKQIRIGSVTKKGYMVVDFSDAFERYVNHIPENSTSQTKQAKQTNIDADSNDVLHPKHVTNVSDAKSEENTDEQRRVSDVSDANPQAEEEREFDRLMGEGV